jgi:adenine phosphoribosyltransferase
MIQEITLEAIKEQIRNVPDFPKPGIQFKDITTILKQPEYFNFLIDTIVDSYKNQNITKVAGIESRGFILGGAIASRLNAGFVPIRKPGKLPAAKYSKKYALEYGIESIEIHQDALGTNEIVLLHDDLLATGGTALAAIGLLNIFKPRKILVNFLCELEFLKGMNALRSYDVTSLIKL